MLTDPIILERYPELEAERVEVVLGVANITASISRSSVPVSNLPGTGDAMLLELAISAKATHLLSHDNDLLSLPTAHTDAAKRLRQRLPKLVIQTSAEFLASAVKK